MSVAVFYITGHGFGHASRDIEVINALADASPETRIVIRTAAPEWLFRLTVRARHEFHLAETDTGIVQVDSLRPDIPETLRRAAAFYADYESRVHREAAWLTALRGAVAVISDIPPLAFDAAARAGVPSYGLSNFTWDWIYDGYEETARQAPGLVDTIRRAYVHAREAWRLPMHGGFETFRRVVDVPFVARHSHREPGETRRAFGLPLDRRVVLSSFGGYGLAGLSLERVDALGEYAIVVTETSTTPRSLAAGAARGRDSALVIPLQEDDIYGRGYRYEDLVRAADVVLTKPGYGIVAECIANETALLYTSRGRFREYDVLVREMPAFLRCGFIEQEVLFTGRWRDTLDRILAQSPPPVRPATDGAEVVAAKIARVLTSG
ncbi:MAG TPA: hypothetical protein VK886_07080 [Vicinamibacterales bacterium]|nr:hypothetical protein [Vicinamibacterales bacterium]